MFSQDHCKDMRCFYHADKEAVGLCKSCARGLCADCAVDIGDGLACRNKCEERARAIQKIVDYNFQQVTKLSGPKVQVLPTPSPVPPPTNSDRQALMTHVRQTRQFQRTSGGFYAAIGGILLVVGILQAVTLPVVLGFCFLVFGAVSLIQARSSIEQKPPETQTK